MYLKSNKAHANVRLAIVRAAGLRDEISDEAADSANEDVTEPIVGIDFDHDCRVVLLEKLLLHPKHKLLIPRRIILAKFVHARRELSLRVHPRHGVRLHGFRHQLEILGRDDVDLQELMRFRWRRHFCFLF